MPKLKRSSSMRYQGFIELGMGPSVVIWGYGKKGKFACRVELNSAGLAVFSGTKGRKKVANVTWDKLVERLTK
jgi:hypothetical protein